MKQWIQSSALLITLALAASACAPKNSAGNKPANAAKPAVEQKAQKPAHGAPDLNKLGARVCSFVINADVDELFLTLHPDILPYMLADQDMDGNTTIPSDEKLEQEKNKIRRDLLKELESEKVTGCQVGAVHENTDCPEFMVKDLGEVGIPVDQCGGMDITFSADGDQDTDTITAMKSRGVWYLADMP
jgi:hypothetical protein